MADLVSPSLMTQVPTEANDQPRYTKAELNDYFARINLPPKYLESPVLSDPKQAKTKEYGLPFIQALTRYHTSNVPFENLELHYSLHKRITLHTDDLYTKFVHRKRGGRCMENNTFFGTVLRSLGYEVRNCAGRVARTMSPFSNVRQSQAATYDGWNHMLNIVRLGDEWYVVDVGMGAMGPNLPYPMRDGLEVTSIAPRKIRLQRRVIAESFASPDLDEAEKPKLWCFDVCHRPGSDSEDTWIPTYCFTTTEFLPQDYEMMSWYTSTHPTSFFTSLMLCTRMVLDTEGEKIVGDITLFQDSVRQTIGGKRELVKECKTEEDRVKGLHEIFGIDLTAEEKSNLPSERQLA